MIIIAIIGILLIIGGISLLSDARKKNKRVLFKAVVQNCTEHASDIIQIGGTKKYDVTFEIQCDTGIRYKSIECNEEYSIGYECQVAYDAQSDSMVIADDSSSEDIKHGWGLIVFGAMCTIIVTAIELGRNSILTEEFLLYAFAYMIALIFMMVGGYMAVIKPMNAKKELEHCHVIPGQLVDYTSRYHNHKMHYYPIYGFTYNGQNMNIAGRISGNFNKFREIGREVTIAVNEKTGEIFCLEDREMENSMGFIFCVIGLGVFIIMLTTSLG